MSGNPAELVIRVKPDGEHFAGASSTGAPSASRVRGAPRPSLTPYTPINQILPPSGGGDASMVLRDAARDLRRIAETSKRTSLALGPREIIRGMLLGTGSSIAKSAFDFVGKYFGLEGKFRDHLNTFRKKDDDDGGSSEVEDVTPKPKPTPPVPPVTGGSVKPTPPVVPPVTAGSIIEHSRDAGPPVVIVPPVTSDSRDAGSPIPPPPPPPPQKPEGPPPVTAGSIIEHSRDAGPPVVIVPPVTSDSRDAGSPIPPPPPPPPQKPEGPPPSVDKDLGGFRDDLGKAGDWINRWTKETFKRDGPSPGTGRMGRTGRMEQGRVPRDDDRGDRAEAAVNTVADALEKLKGNTGATQVQTVHVEGEPTSTVRDLIVRGRMFVDEVVAAEVVDESGGDGGGGKPPRIPGPAEEGKDGGGGKLPWFLAGAATMVTFSRKILAAGKMAVRGLMMLGPAGAAVVASLAGAAAVATAFGGVVLAAKAFTSVLHRTADRLVDYSGQISTAQAHNEVMLERMRISAAQEFGPGLSRAEAMHGRFERQWHEFKEILTRTSVDLFELLEPAFSLAVTVLELGMNIWEMQIKTLEFIMDLSLKFGAAGLFLRVLKTVDKWLQVWVDMTDDEDREDDPFMDEFFRGADKPLAGYHIPGVPVPEGV